MVIDSKSAGILADNNKPNFPVIKKHPIKIKGVNIIEAPSSKLTAYKAVEYREISPSKKEKIIKAKPKIGYIKILEKFTVDILSLKIYHYIELLCNDGES